jgi:hypothetical protein
MTQDDSDHNVVWLHMPLTLRRQCLQLQLPRLQTLKWKVVDFFVLLMLSAAVEAQMHWTCENDHVDHPL